MPLVAVLKMTNLAYVISNVVSFVISFMRLYSEITLPYQTPQECCHVIMTFRCQISQT